MDTGKVLLNQLRYCLNGSETESEKTQVKWWQQRVAELRDHQPVAESAPEQVLAPVVSMENSQMPMAAGFARRDPKACVTPPSSEAKS